MVTLRAPAVYPRTGFRQVITFAQCPRGRLMQFVAGLVSQILWFYLT
jgi:hypothetical protein